MSSEQQPRSLYEILGVPPTASTEDIRTVFRARIMAYHPDRNPSADATEMAALLNEAWHVLGDPERRRAYDAHLEATTARPSAPQQADESSPAATEATSPERSDQPDTSSSERTAWTCPRCSRLVPRHIDDCRCGQSRPLVATTAPQADDTSAKFWPGSAWDWWRAALLIIVVLPKAYTYVTRDDSANSQKVESSPVAVSVAEEPHPSSMEASPLPVDSLASEQTTAEAWAARQQDELRQVEQKRWEERQRQFVTTPQPAPSTAAARVQNVPSPSSRPMPAPTPQVKTPLDRMRDEAVAAFTPTLTALGRRADRLDANFRRYLAGCYGKVTTATTTGTSFGVGSASSSGVIAGTDRFLAWDIDSSVAWQESWATESKIDNATTAHCRTLWSDIAEDASVIRNGLSGIDEAAHRRGIYPGVVRELRAEYGFDR